MLDDAYFRNILKGVLCRHAGPSDDLELDLKTVKLEPEVEYSAQNQIRMQKLVGARTRQKGADTSQRWSAGMIVGAKR